MSVQAGNTLSTVRTAESLADYSEWTFYCGECDLPFMQSFAFHNEEYHDGTLTE
jgi:hypothetical protein